EGIDRATVETFGESFLKGCGRLRLRRRREHQERHELPRDESETRRRRKVFCNEHFRVRPWRTKISYTLRHIWPPRPFQVLETLSTKTCVETVKWPPVKA